MRNNPGFKRLVCTCSLFCELFVLWRLVVITDSVIFSMQKSTFLLALVCDQIFYLYIVSYSNLRPLNRVNSL